MRIVDGRAIAAKILEKLRSESTPKKFLAAVQVGDDASTASFLALKERVAKEIGVDYRLYKFPADIKNDKLRGEFGKIAAHKTCGGIMVELPMPEHLNWHYIFNAIPPEKDIDVLSERALGAFYVDRGKVLPPAVGTVAEIFSEGEVEPLSDHSVAIVGLGLLIGRPAANWIMRRAKETFLLRSVSDLGILKMADIVVTGVGKAGLITPAMLKGGTGIIDFGYGMLDGKYSGDFDARDKKETEKLSFYTPTPGGAGPVLVAKLFENFYALNAER
jgi:methylenetetrahydrofolate dehydrogenase (NADP+)/methenyltetrahydrofolate cyclohydrolase